MSLIIPATVGAITFISGKEILLHSRKEEINRERTDISFVKRLHENNALMLQKTQPSL
jgi:hypothetical protein